jgi:signal transduction histidine kinase
VPDRTAASADVTRPVEIAPTTRRLADAIDAPLVLLDLRGRILHVNEAAVRCLGLPRAELRQRSLPELTASPDDTTDQLRRWAGSSGRRPGTFVPAIGPKAGTTLRCDGARLDADTLIVRLAGDTDTDRLALLSREVETASLRQLQQRLRTSLAELETSNRRLATRNAELDRYAAAVAHDLRTPLYVVKGYAELLAGGALAEVDGDTRRLLEGLVTGAERMGDVIEALLSVARLRVETPPSPVEGADAGAVVRDEVRDATDQLGASLEIGPLPSAWIDRTHLVQVLTNLVANSYRFAHPDRPPHVRITGHRDGDVVTFAVDDDGPGVPHAERERIFELFTRGSTSRDRPGTGIGLATCRKIVESYGGEIRCEDADLGGARFVFTVPDPPAGGEPAV